MEPTSYIKVVGETDFQVVVSINGTTLVSPLTHATLPAAMREVDELLDLHPSWRLKIPDSPEEI